MSTILTSTLLATAFATYPVYGDRPPTTPRHVFQPRIEMTIDKGPIVEMIVRCTKGSAIMSFSKLERVYCTPNSGCTKDLRAAIAESCG